MRKIDPEKHAQKRRAILQAAEHCFVRDGFRGASISDICAEARISPGHLYHYYASKEAIVGAMTEAGLEFAAARFAHIMQNENVVAGLLAEFNRAKPGAERAIRTLMLDMLAEAARNPAISDILREHTKTMRTLLADFLREGQQRGQVDQTLDADTTAAILISVIDGARALTIRDPELDILKAIQSLQTLVSRFLTPPASQPGIE